MIQTHSSAGIAQNPVLAAALSEDEGNCLIAVFDGWEEGIIYTEHSTPQPKEVLKKGDIIIRKESELHFLKYRKDWNILMNVVEKIVNTDTGFSNTTGKAFFMKHMMFHEVIGNIDKLWKLVVDYVISYNSWVSER